MGKLENRLAVRISKLDGMIKVMLGVMITITASLIPLIIKLLFF